MLIFQQAIDAEKALKFHSEHLSPYLWPRTIEDFKDFIEEAALFEVVTEDGDMVAICYVKPPSITEKDGEAEFGGIYVSSEYRGQGIALFLGIVSISNFFISEHKSSLMQRGQSGAFAG